MVEVAWRAVKADHHWKKFFEELKRCMHKNQAIVAIVCQMLSIVWYVLSWHEPYKPATVEKVLELIDTESIR